MKLRLVLGTFLAGDFGEDCFVLDFVDDFAAFLAMTTPVFNTVM